MGIYLKEIIMSVEVIRKYFANVKFWFKSWIKDKDHSILKSIINALQSIKDLLASLVINDLTVEDRITIGDVTRETEVIANAINAEPIIVL